MPDSACGRMKLRLRRSLFVGLTSISLAVAWVAREAHAIPETAERWYRVEVSGQPAGWAVERTRETGSEIRTEEEMQISVSRGETPLSLRVSTFFVETLDAEPREMGMHFEMGAAPIETQWRFLPGGVERWMEGERVAVEPSPPAGWLTPAAAEKAVRRQRAEGATKIEYRVLDASLGLAPVSVVETRVAAREEIALPEGPIVVSRWRRTTSGETAAAETTLFLDEAGREVRAVAEIVGLPMVLTLTTRARALAKHGAPEMLAGTVVHPIGRLESRRRLERVTYRLSRRHGAAREAMFDELPSRGGQRVEILPDGAWVRVAAHPSSEPEPETDLERYLGASPYLDYRDPEVAALHARALADAPSSPAARAETLRHFVHRYVERKNLETGFAAASEVARRRAGDCTEHATLLAALLRAERIPARLVSGLLYVDEFAGQNGVFGYHMWVQAYLEGRWVDLDAITGDAFDAKHIALSTTEMRGPEDFAQLGARIASGLGTLEIEIVETTDAEEP